MSDLAVSQLLAGAFDCHVHSYPDVVPRKLNDLDLVRQARRAGMRALVLKGHHGCTCERAYLLNQLFPDFQVFGGVVLNDTAGGFNPHAVEAALKMGAAQIWMPTKSAANHQAHLGGRGGLSILDGARLRPAVVDVLRLAAAADAIVATGHLSPEESRILTEEALALGVRRISVTHPEWGVTAMPIETQQRLAAHAGVYFERCLVSTCPELAFTVPFAELARQIRAVGPGTTIAATDHGLPSLPAPAEAMANLIRQLLAEGFSEAEVRLMVQTNPAKLLKLA
jgi:hypothetical protein